MAENTAPEQRRRKGLLVSGVVQGVGFRPFVYRLALEEGLAGTIGNDTDGVTIEIEGPEARIDAFLTRLRAETPPLARIDSVVARELPETGEPGFRIVSSQVLGRVSTGIPADAATCADCLRELLDPQDRRYRYPFLNCTNCGPRFTITRRIPYDRPQTSMAKFPMCPTCQAEYDDPLNRRFHAQPNACPECGPRVWLEGADEEAQPGEFPEDHASEELQAAEEPLPGGKERQGTTSVVPQAAIESIRALAPEGRAALSPKREPILTPMDATRKGCGSVTGHDFSRAEDSPDINGALAPGGCLSGAANAAPNQDHSDAIDQTVELLLAGQVVAIKGIGGFHLAVDATNEAAVMRLRQRKHRYGKPLAVMVRDTQAARMVCSLTAEEEALLMTAARPIVLAHARQGNGIAADVAPGIPWLGVFLPYAPLQHLLFADARVKALVMTSANLSEEPIAIDNSEARVRLGAIADAFLMHDREILQRCDDSVAAVVDGAPQLIRRARGFVPLGVELGLHFDAPPLLAVGGHLKNVFALARGRHVYQSQHLGDLESLTGLEFFKESLDHLMRTFEIEPQTVVHDMHPGYLSTEWAKQWAAEGGLRTIAVQHHHAHVAGCMAEHGLEGPVIGLALDGTGYGTDGRIWGGEVLIARLDGFERYAHLEYVPMPGSTAAIKEPWRMALGALHAAGFDVESEQIVRLLGAQPSETRVLKRMIERGINSPVTSSLGRLFDAVAAVVLNRRVVDYEAQAAIELEGIAVEEPDRFEQGVYVPELHGPEEGSASAVIRTGKMWKAVLDDLWRGVPARRIAARFHAGIAEGFINAAGNARIETDINTVALSGGCMANRRLARLLRTGLEEEGFTVLQHRNVSPGDGGLSYGQVAVAASIIAKWRE